MIHRHTRELDVFYNEHRDACTNCGKNFKMVCVRIWDMTQKEILLFYVMIAHICYQKP